MGKMAELDAQQTELMESIKEQINQALRGDEVTASSRPVRVRRKYPSPLDEPTNTRIDQEYDEYGRILRQTMYLSLIHI